MGAALQGDMRQMDFETCLTHVSPPSLMCIAVMPNLPKLMVARSMVLARIIAYGIRETEIPSRFLASAKVPAAFCL